MRKRRELEEKGWKIRERRTSKSGGQEGKVEGTVKHFKTLVPEELARKVEKQLKENGELAWNTEKRRRIIHE